MVEQMLELSRTLDGRVSGAVCLILERWCMGATTAGTGVLLFQKHFTFRALSGVQGSAHVLAAGCSLRCCVTPSSPAVDVQGQPKRSMCLVDRLTSDGTGAQGPAAQAVVAVSAVVARQVSKKRRSGSRQTEASGCAGDEPYGETE